ncbi:hypothetical protein [Rhizobium rhizogenes]|uniref:hypothetical protein n=1 Tax=Rhizobium rhizogenes TaxID=359 RepID=UPI001F2D8894|nr:hypothetical protein [Rhizobium rhizogenes]
MTDSQLLVADTLGAAVDELCQKFGAWRTARALLLVAWRRHQTHTHISELSNYQLRDIGMPERKICLRNPISCFGTSDPSAKSPTQRALELVSKTAPTPS